MESYVPLTAFALLDYPTNVTLVRMEGLQQKHLRGAISTHMKCYE